LADETTISEKNPVQTVGRRKSAVARVVLRPGGGEWTVNGRSLEEYFPVLRHRKVARRPLEETGTAAIYDVLVRASGGGITGQADAIQLGVARALVEADESHKEVLRAKDLLTRDPRQVERKKPGRPKARKKGQFSKR